MIKLTPDIREEVVHKMSIMLEDRDQIVEDGWTVDECRNIDLCARNDGDFALLTDRERALCAQELKNTEDIADDNKAYFHNKGERDAVRLSSRWIRALRSAITELDA